MSESHGILPVKSIYTPLNLGHRGMSTRLVRILPELSSEGLIQCELVSANIECRSKHRFEKGFENCTISRKQPEQTYDGTDQSSASSSATSVNQESACIEFWALSYLWGAEDDGRPITVNGLTHAVQPNLFNFLERARHLPGIESQWAWIDALCINQSDVAERNYQVQSMGLVYSHAVSTITWLGTDLEALDPLFDFVMQVWIQMKRAFWHSPEDVLVLRKRLQESSQKVDYPLNSWNADFQQLTSGEYWTRAWVYQELYLAKKRRLFTGSRVVDLRPVMRCKSFIEESQREPDKDVVKGRSERSALDHLLQRIGNAHPDGLVISFGSKVLFENSCTSLQCAETKDYIFSQLSLADNHEDFHVDYEEDSLSFFLKVVRFCARARCPGAAPHFIQGWHHILRTLHIDPSDLQSMVELKRLTGVASHATLLTAFENNYIVLLTRSMELRLEDGYSSYDENGENWVEVVYVKVDESKISRQDSNSPSMKSICIHTPNSQVSFISSDEDETPTRIEVVGPQHFSRPSTTIKEIGDYGIQMSLADLTWVISCLCQNDNSSQHQHFPPGSLDVPPERKGRPPRTRTRASGRHNALT